VRDGVDASEIETVAGTDAVEIPVLTLDADTDRVGVGVGDQESLLVELDDRESDVVGEYVTKMDAEPDTVSAEADRDALPEREGEEETDMERVTEGDAEMDRVPLTLAVCEVDLDVERVNDGDAVEEEAAARDPAALRENVTVAVDDDEIEGENEADPDRASVLDLEASAFVTDSVALVVSDGDRDGESVFVPEGDGDVDCVEQIVDVGDTEFDVERVRVGENVGDALFDDDPVPQNDDVGDVLAVIERDVVTDGVPVAEGHTDTVDVRELVPLEQYDPL
jgi:hypothetical protein